MPVALALLWRGGYRFLEKAQLIILAIMLPPVFVAVFYVRPDWPAALDGFLIPHALQYREWAFQVVPKLSRRSEWVEVPVYDLAIFLAFFGILLGGPENAVPD